MINNQMKSFKKVFRAEQDYLHNNKNYIIYKTIFEDENDQKFLNLIRWCEENVKGSFSIAKNQTTNFMITVRIWDEESRKKFEEKFSNFLVKE